MAAGRIATRRFTPYTGRGRYDIKNYQTRTLGAYMTDSIAMSIDCPVGGWNAIDSVDNMPATDAILLDNLIPGAGTVDTRLGTIVYGDTGTGLPVETVASLDSATESKLIVASNGGIWDMTDSDVAAHSNAVSKLHNEGTFLNSRWQHTNFRRADDTGVLIMCNGEDPSQEYAEPFTGLTEMAFTDDAEPPAPIVGDFIGVVVFKGRTYYWRDNESSFWYAQAGGYKGVMKEYPLGSFVQRGGKVMMITTWTQQDSGDGKDDFLVIVFSTGEILMYQGDDPESIGFFEMVGRYVTAEPLSVRGNDKYGSDIIIMTKDGYIALSTIVQRGRVSDVPAFSRLINGAITKRTKVYDNYYGWDCALFAKQGLFLFNVPVGTASFEQHVMNTVTQRWCRFKGIDVSCFDIHNERLFGGDSTGRVIGMLEGTADLGGAINFTALPAYNYMEDPGHRKHLTAIQVLTTHSRPDMIRLTGYADFAIPTLPPVQLPVDTSVCVWSVNPDTPPQAIGSFWDEDYWAVGDSPYTYKGWQNISAYGYAVSYLMRFAKINESVSWRSTNLRFHIAGAN